MSCALVAQGKSDLTNLLMLLGSGGGVDRWPPTDRPLKHGPAVVALFHYRALDPLGGVEAPGDVGDQDARGEQEPGFQPQGALVV